VAVKGGDCWAFAAGAAAIGSTALLASEFCCEQKPNLEPKDFIPTQDYTKMTLEGWTVYVSPELTRHGSSERRKVGSEAVKLLQWQLFHITRLVSDEALAHLQKVPIWLEAEIHFGAAEYHMSAEWLAQNGYNPEKAHCVEICNSTDFVAWGSDDQPTMLLHELAHSYHDRVLGLDHPMINEHFAQAEEKGIYDTVLRITGHQEKHYAMTNKFEFFASLTVCYFTVNDWFPFVRSEFQQFDPDTYAMMEELWGPRRHGLDLPTRAGPPPSSGALQIPMRIQRGLTEYTV
jgi:hypothetical protein